MTEGDPPKTQGCPRVSICLHPGSDARAPFPAQGEAQGTADFTSTRALSGPWLDFSDWHWPVLVLKSWPGAPLITAMWHWEVTLPRLPTLSWGTGGQFAHLLSSHVKCLQDGVGATFLQACLASWLASTDRVPWLFDHSRTPTSGRWHPPGAWEVGKGAEM